MSEPHKQPQHGPNKSATSLRTITLAVFAVSFLAYILLLTKNYYWDGIFFAQVIEDAPRINATLFHPSHLLDLVFEYALYRGVRLLGFDPRAVAVLQVSNCVLGAAAVTLFFRICVDWFKSVYVSLITAALLAFSATWWRFATDADTYISAVLFLLIAFYLLSPDRRTQPFAVGLAHASAMLLHQLAVFFFPVAIAGLVFQAKKNGSKDIWRSALGYTVTATVLTVGIYYVVFHAVAGTWSFSRFVGWITYFSPENGFSFSASSNLGYTFRSQVRMFLGGRVAFVREFGPLMVVLALLTGLAIVALVVALLRRWKEVRQTFRAPLAGRFKSLAILSTLWIAPYVVFLFFFIPQNVFYRLFYLPAIMVIAGGALSAMHSSPGHVCRYRAALFAVAIFLANLTFSQYPYTQVRANPPLQLALSLNKIWSTGTVVYYALPNTDGSLVRYFNPGTVWVQVAPEQFPRQLEQLPRTTSGGWLETTLVDQLETTAEGRAWLSAHAMRRSDCELVNSKFRIRFYQLKAN